MKFPWLQTVTSNVVPSIQSIHHVTSGSGRLPIDSHLKVIPDMNSSPIRVPTDFHSIPINHMNSNPRIVNAPWDPKSNSRYDINSFGPVSHLHFPHTMIVTTKSYISPSCKSFPCKRQMSDTSDEFPCNIKFPSIIKSEDQECFPHFPTKDGDVYSNSIAPCVNATSQHKVVHINNIPTCM